MCRPLSGVWSGGVVNGCVFLYFYRPVLQYTERDQDGSYTMLGGDIVKFNIATDKRDGSHRATNVQLHKLVEGQQAHVTRAREKVMGCGQCTGVW